MFTLKHSFARSLQIFFSTWRKSWKNKLLLSYSISDIKTHRISKRQSARLGKVSFKDSSELVFSGDEVAVLSLDHLDENAGASDGFYRLGGTWKRHKGVHVTACSEHVVVWRNRTRQRKICFFKTEFLSHPLRWKSRGMIIIMFFSLQSTFFMLKPGKQMITNSFPHFCSVCPSFCSSFYFLVILKHFASDAATAMLHSRDGVR